MEDAIAAASMAKWKKQKSQLYLCFTAENLSPEAAGWSSQPVRRFME